MNGIFISGPYSRYLWCRLPFDNAARQLKRAGFRPINPARIVPREWPFDMSMKLCLDLIDISDAVLQLDGWDKSIGAVKEWHHAVAANKPVYHSVDALRRGREGGCYG